MVRGDVMPMDAARRVRGGYKEDTMNQKERILERLRRRPKLGVTTLELEHWLDIVDPGRRIRELREDGHEIVMKSEKRSMSGRKVNVYRLKEAA